MRRHRQHGFTILELLITLAIVGGMVFLGANALLRVRKSKLRDASTAVAGSVRLGFDRALATGKHHRLVFDLDKQKYWIERCERPPALHRAVDLKEEHDREQKEAEEKLRRLEAQQATLTTHADDDEKKKKEGEPPEECPKESGDAVTPLAPAEGAEQPPCCRPRGGIGTVHELKKGVKLQSVNVAHLREKSTEGQVRINFFPLGYAEKAVVLLVDGDDNVFSVVLEPLTGRVRVMTRPPKDEEGGAVHADAVGKDGTAP